MAKSETRDRIVAVARERFRREGLHGPALAEIAEAAGVPRGSIAFHVPGGRRELALAVVRLAESEIGDAIDAGRERGVSAARALETLTAMVGAMLEASDYRDGCPVAAVAHDAGGDEELLRACRLALDRWSASAARWLEHEGLGADEAAELGTLIVSTVEGSLMTARLRRDVAPLESAAVYLAAMVDRAVAAVRRGPVAGAGR